MPPGSLARAAERAVACRSGRSGSGHSFLRPNMMSSQLGTLGRPDLRAAGAGRGSGLAGGASGALLDDLVAVAVLVDGVGPRRPRWRPSLPAARSAAARDTGRGSGRRRTAGREAVALERGLVACLGRTRRSVLVVDRGCDVDGVHGRPGVAVVVAVVPRRRRAARRAARRRRRCRRVGARSRRPDDRLRLDRRVIGGLDPGRGSASVVSLGTWRTGWVGSVRRTWRWAASAPTRSSTVPVLTTSGSSSGWVWAGGGSSSRGSRATSSSGSASSGASSSPGTSVDLGRRRRPRCALRSRMAAMRSTVSPSRRRVADAPTPPSASTS